MYGASIITTVTTVELVCGLSGLPRLFCIYTIIYRTGSCTAAAAAVADQYVGIIID